MSGASGPQRRKDCSEPGTVHAGTTHQLLPLQVCEVRASLLKSIKEGQVPKYSRNMTLHNVGENVYRLDIEASSEGRLCRESEFKREFIVVFIHVHKAEPPAQFTIYYSHHEYEERQSVQLRWKIQRISTVALDRALKQTIATAVVWAWGWFSMNEQNWIDVKPMNAKNDRGRIHLVAPNFL